MLNSNLKCVKQVEEAEVENVTIEYNINGIDSFFLLLLLMDVLPL